MILQRCDCWQLMKGLGELCTPKTVMYSLVGPKLRYNCLFFPLVFCYYGNDFRKNQITCIHYLDSFVIKLLVQYLCGMEIRLNSLNFLFALNVLL